MGEETCNAGSSAPVQKPIKYRLACDGCQHSKIRCNQEKPRCRRCSKKGMDCVYSPARRAGRPRTRKDSKSSPRSRNAASPSLSEHIAMTKDITTSVSTPISPYSLHGTMSSSGHGFTSCSCSNASVALSMSQTIQAPVYDDTNLYESRFLGENFLQDSTNTAGVQCETPKQVDKYYFQLPPEILITPELLGLGFCEGPSESLNQYQQQDPEHSRPMISSLNAFDERQQYLGLPTPEESSSHLDLNRRSSVSTATSSSKSVGNFTFETMRQDKLRDSRLSDYATSSTKSCSCIARLFEHLSTPTQALVSSSSPTSTSTALSTSRLLIESCYATMACPNSCSTRPSAALVICEAIDRALLSLDLRGTSLWRARESHEVGRPSASPSPSSPSAPSAVRTSKTLDMVHQSPVADEEHEPLHCGTLPIRGADRRAVLRVLRVKRAREMQGVLEQLRNKFRVGTPLDRQATTKPLLRASCADIIGGVIQRVTESVELVRIEF